MSDPVLEAVSAVEVDGDHDDPGAGLEAIGEEAGARPEGPAPEIGDDADALDEDSGTGFDVFSWASRVPEGSHLDFEAREWWDPDTGGKTRLAYHLSDATPDGVGYPNAIGVLVGAAELYWSKVIQGGGRGGDDRDGEQDAPDAETVDRNTAEAYV